MKLLPPLLLAVCLLLLSHFVAFQIGRGARPEPYDYQPSVPRFRVERATGKVEQLRQDQGGFSWVPLGQR
jgi:hypothetical protein